MMPHMLSQIAGLLITGEALLVPEIAVLNRCVPESRRIRVAATKIAMVRGIFRTRELESQRFGAARFETYGPYGRKGFEALAMPET